MNVLASEHHRSAPMARHRARRALSAVLIAAACSAHVTHASSAWAQPSAARAPAETSPRGRARELGERGLAAYDAGDYSRALELFREALELYDFPTLRLYIARSLAKQGNPVAAAREFEALLALPAQADEGEAGIEARAAAAAERRDVEARRPRLTLAFVGGSVEGARVELNGQARPDIVPGRETFVEPGVYEIRATHPDGRTAQRSLTLLEGRAERVDLVWSAPAPPAATAAPLAVPGSTQVGSEGPAPMARESTNTGAWVAGVITGVLLGGTLVTGIIAAGRKDDYDDANERSDVSEDRKRALRESALDMQVLNTIFAAGAVLGASSTLYFALRQPAPEAAGLASAPNGWQLGVRGVF